MEEQPEYGIKVIDKRLREEPETAVAVQGESSSAMVMLAMNKGYTPEFIEKMMDLAERNQRNIARQAFYEAVAAFKENPPEVLKDKENSQFSKGDKKAMYVSLGNLLKTVNPALGKHGLSVSFEIKQAEKLVTVSCKLSHRMGHSEIVTMEAPPDISGGNAKNPIQQIKSTVTYLRAATFEAVTGLAATDEANLDDDGEGAGTEYINEDQLIEVQDLLKLINSDGKPMLKHFGLESIEKIPATLYGRVLTALKKKVPKAE